MGLSLLPAAVPRWHYYQLCKSISAKLVLGTFSTVLQTTVLIRGFSCCQQKCQGGTENILKMELVIQKRLFWFFFGRLQLFLSRMASRRISSVTPFDNCLMKHARKRREREREKEEVESGGAQRKSVFPEWGWVEIQNKIKWIKKSVAINLVFFRSELEEKKKKTNTKNLLRRPEQIFIYAIQSVKEKGWNRNCPPVLYKAALLVVLAAGHCWYALAVRHCWCVLSAGHCWWVLAAGHCSCVLSAGQWWCVLGARHCWCVLAAGHC